MNVKLFDLDFSVKLFLGPRNNFNYGVRANFLNEHNILAWDIAETCSKSYSFTFEIKILSNEFNLHNLVFILNTFSLKV